MMAGRRVPQNTAEYARWLAGEISRRYRDSEVLEEAVATFPSTTVVRDFDTAQIRRPD